MTLIFSTRKKEKKSSKTPEINIKRKTIYSTNKSPDAIGPYKKGYIAGDLLFCSGQIGLNPDTMNLVEGGIEKETRQVCRNISGVLKDFGMSLKDVVKTTIFLTDIENFEKVNKVYRDYFILKPARSAVEISGLPKGASIEIEVIAKIN